MPNPSAEASTPHPTGRWQRLALSPWLPAGLALLCFANSIPNDFAYDDRALVLDNPRIASLANVRAIWLSDWWKLVENEAEANPQRDRLYRPLTLFSFALNYAVHAYRPAGYHLVNVLLHAGVCVLVWYFARRLSGDAAVASLAAVLFAVHPVHVEAVANVVGRAEILVTLFLLGGLLVLAPRNGLPGAGRGLLAALLFLLALLSKESAICYPAVALLWLYWTQREHRPGWRWWAVQTALLVPPLLVYFPLRYVALEHHLLRTELVAILMNPIVTATGLARVLAPFTVLGHYVRLLGVPAGLSCDYGIAIVDPRQGVTLMTVLGMAATGGLAVGLFGLSRRTADWRQVGLLTAMFLASYALISNTVLLIGVDLAERFMYWPSVPVFVLLAFGIVEFGRRQCAVGRPLAQRAGLLRVLGVLLLAALALRSLARNLDWASNGALFAADVRTHPEGAHLNHGSALELVRVWHDRHAQGMSDAPLKLAQQYLDRALQIHPGYVEALALRGQVRAQLGEIDGALLDVEAVIQLDPGSTDARRTLAQLVYGRDADARLADLRAKVTAQPDDPEARQQFGQALLEYGQTAEAQQELEAALKLAPDNVAALRELGKVLAIRDRNDEAIATFQRVLALAPQDWQAHANLATLLAPRNPAQALQHARRAYELKPGEPRNSINLAEAYALNGQTAAAVEIYQKVQQQLDQDDPLREVVAQRLQFLRAGR
jgi:tetratricopeptide (TPR) repeat protein